MEALETTALVTMQQLLNMLLMDSEVEVIDRNDTVKWRGKAREVPWSLTEEECVQAEARGDTLRVTILESPW